MTVSAGTSSTGTSKRWGRARPLVSAAGAFVASLVAIAAVAGVRLPTGFIKVLFVVLLVCAYRLDRALHDLVSAGDRRPSLQRAGIASAALAVGVGLTIVGARDAVVVVLGWPIHLGGLFFVGPAIGVVAAAGLLSEARMHARTHLAPLLACFVGAVALASWAAIGARADRAWAAAVVAAVVLGEVGTELLSERATGWELAPGRRRWVSAVGLAMVALTGFALWGWNLSVGQAIGLLLILLVVSWMATSDNDALFVVVPVIALALLWASGPRTPTTEEQGRVDDHQAVAGEPYFLVLGDSYTSGEGAQAYLAGTNTVRRDPVRHDNQCRQAPTAWPWLLAEAHPGDVPARLLFEACSGAVAENIASTRSVVLSDGSTRHVGGTAELDLARRDIAARGLGRPDLIILGVGGNDAGFSRLGTTCVGPGNCAELATAFTRSTTPDPATVDPSDLGPAELEDIGDDLHRAYDHVALAFPGVPVVVTAYPQPVSIGSPCPSVLLDNDERLFINEFVSALDVLVEREAIEHGFGFLEDLRGSLQSHGLQLCDPSNHGNTGLNFIGLNPKVGTTKDYLDPTAWNHNSFHPNERGHQAMADTAIAWFAATHLPAMPLPHRPQRPTGHVAVAVPVLDQEVAVAQCHASDPLRCDIVHDGWLTYEVVDGYRRVIAPMALVMVGWWLVLLSFRPWLPRWLRAQWSRLPE